MLRLRGLMVIPTPHDDPGLGRPAFRPSRALFDKLREHHPGVDTLSMGLSSDAAVAIADCAPMVRIGPALFGPREASPGAPPSPGLSSVSNAPPNENPHPP